MTLQLKSTFVSFIFSEFLMQLMASPLTAVATINTSHEGVSNYFCGPSQWIIVGVPEQDLVDQDDIPMQTEPTATGQVVRGSSFRCKDSMVLAIHAYHSKNFWSSVQRNLILKDITLFASLEQNARFYCKVDPLAIHGE